MRLRPRFNWEPAMAKKGLCYSPLTIIQNLRHNLRSGYDPESIPRELIQNADDAGANCLHFGWTSGLGPGSTSNPLLEDPALFAVNDGPFTDPLGAFGRDQIEHLRLPFRRPHIALLGALWVR